MVGFCILFCIMGNTKRGTSGALEGHGHILRDIEACDDDPAHWFSVKEKSD